MFILHLALWLYVYISFLKDKQICFGLLNFRVCFLFQNDWFEITKMTTLKIDK